MVHLRDAMVDARGDLYAVGRIEFPPDPGGLLRPMQAGLVRIRFADSGAMEVTASHAGRDPHSGYLAAEREGPTLHVPSAIGTLVADVLRFGHHRNPVEFELDLAGALSLDTDGVLTRQGVSRWRGRIRPIEGDMVAVELSAVLSSLPDDALDRLGAQPWPRDPSAPRVEASFTMDAVTRVVGLGAHSNELPDLPWAPGDVDTGTLGSMRLESTPIGSVGQMWGRSDDGRAVEVYQSRRPLLQLTLHAPVPARRTAAGLMVYEGAFPRVTFVGIDLDVVARAMWSTRAFGVTLTGGEVGSLELFGGREAFDAHRRLTEAHLDFELTTAGLHLSYTADVDGGEGLAGAVTLPWEVLVLKSRLFVRHQDALIG